MLEFFKKLFGKKSSNNETAPEKDGEKTIIKNIEMKHVDDILLYLKKDHYTEGYVTALKVPDKQMAKISLEAIKANYLGYIQKVKNHYEKRKKELEKIRMLNEGNSMYDLMKDNEKELETIENEMQVLLQIREDVIQETENGYFQFVIKTFWRGFFTGFNDVIQGKIISGSMDVSSTGRQEDQSDDGQQSQENTNQ